MYDGQWKEGRACGAALHIKGGGGGKHKSVHDTMTVGGAGNRRGIGARGRLVMGVWKEGGGREVEGDTLADVEDRLLRKEAFSRYQEWLRALWRGDEAAVARGLDEKVCIRMCSVLDRVLY